VRVRAFPDPACPDLAACFEFYDAPVEGAEPHDADPLGALIGLRHTNRRLGERRRLSPEALGSIVAAARSIPGADMLTITDDAALDEVGRLIAAGDRLRLLHRRLNEEMMRELRWSWEEARATRDGIPVDTLELSDTDRAGLQICRDARAMELVAELGGGAALEKTAKKSIASASAVALITMPAARPIDYFNGGRAVQRAWLEATRREVAFYPQTTNPYLFARLVRGGGEGLPEAMQRSLRALRERHLRLFPVTDRAAEVLLFRLARVGPASARALRRPVEDVLTMV
jgi:hypothetical protein